MNTNNGCFPVCPECNSTEIRRVTGALDAEEIVECSRCHTRGTGMNLTDAYMAFFGYVRPEIPQVCPVCGYQFRDGPEPSVVGVVRFQFGYVCRECKQIFIGNTAG